MRSNETRRDISGFARMVIGENENDRSSLTRNDDYPSKGSTIHYSKSSIIRIENGLFFCSTCLFHFLSSRIKMKKINPSLFRFSWRLPFGFMWIYSFDPFLRIDLCNVSIFIDCLSQSNNFLIDIWTRNDWSLILFQVVQEYERAVMFRLGRILGGAKVCSLIEESHH